MADFTIYSPGTSGPRGKGWITEPRPPTSADGLDGDWFINNLDPTALVLYGPKAAGAWPAGNVLSSGGGPWVFDVKAYGAVGDGVTDDTAAIRATINAAVAYAQSSSQHYAEVKLSNATYLLSSAPVKGGTTKGNAVLPLPVIAPTASKVTLKLTGVGKASALPHWQQTSPQVSGTVLRCTTQELAIDATYGELSVIGGPTPQQGYALGSTTLFNNMMLVVDRVQIQTKHDHTAGYTCGIDLRGMAEMHIMDASAQTDATPPTIVFPGGAGWEFGLAAPFPANNAFCKIDSWSCEGFTYGCWLSEHVMADVISCVYCYNGVTFIGSYEGSGGVQHTCHVAYACIEACTNAMSVTQVARLQVDQLDVENISAMHVFDPGGTSVGYVGLAGIIPDVLVTAGSKIEVKYLDRAPGAFAAPAMPASGAAFRSTAWRDAAVTITGGTVTAITVDGQVTGLTSGTVIVPSGRTIAVTYSSAPAWTWMMM